MRHVMHVSVCVSVTVFAAEFELGVDGMNLLLYVISYHK